MARNDSSSTSMTTNNTPSSASSAARESSLSGGTDGNNNNNNSNPEPPHRSYDHPYRLTIYFAGRRRLPRFPEHTHASGSRRLRTVPTPSPSCRWLALVQLECHDLPQLMREGLDWDAAKHIIPELGYVYKIPEDDDDDTDSDDDTDDDSDSDTTAPKDLVMERVWTTRELPAGSTASTSRWFGTVTMRAGSVDELADVDLNSLLRRQRIAEARGLVFDTQATSTAKGRRKSADHRFVFQYAVDPELGNINCIYDRLHPRHGSWWFWPDHGGVEEDEEEREEGEERCPSYEEAQRRRM